MYVCLCVHAHGNMNLSWMSFMAFIRLSEGHVTQKVIRSVKRFVSFICTTHWPVAFKRKMHSCSKSL